MIRLLRLSALIPALLLAACGGDSRLPELELSGSTMGTSFNILLVDPAEDLAKDRLQSGIAETLERIDQLASTWRDDSEVSALNANPDTNWIDVSAELCAALEQTLEVSKQSNGAFDVTVGPLVNLWGFGPGGDVSEPPDDDELEAVMATVGYRNLRTRCDQPAVRKQNSAVYVDLSGWAKGFAVDELAALLDEYNLRNYLVEIGGELRVRGYNAEGLKWAVAVEAPSKTRRKPHSVLRVTDTSVATSGDYRNYFDHDGRHYSHTIDARTGKPISHQLAAVTVVSDSAAYADAMATALLVLGPKEGLELAESLDLAGYFLIRGTRGIQELTTRKFDLLRD